jgi:tetratricopeptide (TPR) repeat protein
MKLFSRINIIIFLILAILIGCEITESDELLNQGIALLEEGEYDRAIADFNKAIELKVSMIEPSPTLIRP